MLSLTLNQGDYLSIGDNIIVQLGRISGDRCKLTVHAPREVPVFRGEVLERTGAERPGCVLDANYVEFQRGEFMSVLREISNHAVSVRFTPLTSGELHMEIVMPYFVSAR